MAFFDLTCAEIDFQGSSPTRSRLNATMFLLRLDIDVQFVGVEMIDSRQYRYT